MRTSADYTDYAHFGLRQCSTVRQKNLYWRDTRFDSQGRHQNRRRNLRNLCNLRIFNFGFSQSAVQVLCFNNLRFR
jgi:hypothetical protein